MYNKAFRSML